MATVRRDIVFLVFSQFGVSFSFNFIFSFLPFHIRAISPYAPAQTLLWTGVIMGITGTGLAFSSPLFGMLAHRVSPKRIFLLGVFAYSVLFLLMGFTTDLRLIALLRALQGVVGGVSVIGLIIITAISPKEKIVAYFGLYQNSITLGLLVGPPLGSVAFTVFGYRDAFIVASAVLFAAFALSLLFVTPIPALARKTPTERTTVDRKLFAAYALCFLVQIQLIHLMAVMPTIFRSFNLESSGAVQRAGLLLTLETASAAVGTFLWCRVAEKTGAAKMIGVLVPAALAVQCLLIFPTGFAGLAAVRMVQTGLVSAVIPLTFSLFADVKRGGVLGFLTSSRFVGNAVGPFMATSIVAAFSLTSLYLSVAAVTLVAFLSFRRVLNSP